MPFVFEEEPTQTEQPRYVLEPKPSLLERAKSALPSMPDVAGNLRKFGRTFESEPAGKDDSQEQYQQRAAAFRESLKSGKPAADPVKALFPEDKNDFLSSAGRAIKSGVEDVGRSVIGAYESLDPTREPTTTKPGASLLHAAEPILSIIGTTPPALGGTMVGETVRSGLESAGASPNAQALLGTLANVLVPGKFVPNVVRGVRPSITPERQAAIDIGRARIKSKQASEPAFAETLREQITTGKLADESGFVSGTKGAESGRYVFEKPDAVNAISPERQAAIAKGQARMSSKKPEVSNAKTQPSEVQAPVSEVIPPVVEAGKVEAPAVLTAPEVVAKIESQQNPEFFDKPAIEKQVEKGGENYVRVEVDPNELTTRKDVEPGVSVQDKGPIVVDQAGKVIDGNHRAVDAVAKGETIEAYVPETSKLAKQRSYDDVQSAIDGLENRLEAQGMDVIKLAPKADVEAGKLPPEYKAMPLELERLYNERDAIGAGELAQSKTEIIRQVESVGLKGDEIRDVLQTFSIDPDRIDAGVQAHAGEWAKWSVDRTPEISTRELAGKLAARRGEMFDEFKDISRKTVADAARAVKAVREYFGVKEDTYKPFAEVESANPREVAKIEAPKPATDMSMDAAEATAREARQEIYRRVKVEAEKAGETIEEAAERLKLPAGMLARLKAEQEAPPITPPAAVAQVEAPEGGFITSIKNAQIDKELSELGRPPATHGERVTFEQSRAEAAQAMQIDPFVGQKLVNELVGKPRPATAFEDALLLHEQTRLKNERILAEDGLIAAQKSGDPALISEAKARVESATADFMTLSDVVTQVGTESSLSLGHRRMMMKEDYSLASMERAKQVSNDGAPLTDAQRAEVKTLHDKINSTQKAFDEYVAKTEIRRAEMESEIAHSRMVNEQPQIDPHIKSMAERIIMSMESQAESARVRLKAKLSSLHAGIDPTILSDMAIIGAAKLARKAMDFTNWSKAMLDDLGDGISPYLNDVWAASNKKLDGEIAPIAGKSSEPVKRVLKTMPVAERQAIVKEQIRARVEEKVDISAQAQTLAKLFIEQGVKGRDALIDAVHGELKDIDPNITRRQAMDAISGYGKYTQLSHEQIASELRDLKGQMQQVAKLEDIQSRQPPLRTGVERRAISDEERHLIQQVNEAKRRFGVVITDPATQLQSALGARKTYYHNAISDLEAQIAAKEKFVKEKTASPTDPELKNLKARYDEAKKEFDEVFGKPEMTDEQRIGAAMRGTERSIAQLEKKIADNDLGPPEKIPELTSPALEAVRARRDALQAQLQELRDIAFPGKTPEEVALQTLKARLKHQTADMLDRLDRGDFTKKPPREVKFDKEAHSLNYEHARVKAQWHQALFNDSLAHRSKPKKVLDAGIEVLNTSRAVLTSVDLSAVLRQGGFISLGHPIRAAKALPDMFRAFMSEKGQYRATQEILNRENYPLYKRSKLYLSEEGGTSLSQMEEAYMSRWSSHIPLVAGSQRAYTTFLNKLRADSFDAMEASLSRSVKATPEEANAIANFINVSTGRGNLGMHENALVGLNTFFFAPRYVASRFQLIAGQPFYRGSLRTRAAVAKEYAKALTGLGMVYGLSSMAGAEIEIDPRSSDFGKIKIGNTRVDPMMGLSQVSVLLGRLASGETKTLKGRVSPIRGDKKAFGAGDSADVIARFLRSKLSPSVGTGINILAGKNVVGEPTTPESVALNMAVPLAMQDIYEAMKDQGVPQGAALGVLGTFGMSLQTFDSNKKRVIDRSTFAQRWGFSD